MLATSSSSTDKNTGDPKDQLRFQLEQLGHEAAKYANSQLNEKEGTEWQWFVIFVICSTLHRLTFCLSTSSEAQLVMAANACASVIYDADGEPSVPGLEFGPRQCYLTPSTTGTSKATGLWVLHESRAENIESPVIFVAVRGTASVLDAVVNLHGQKQNAVSLLVSMILSTYTYRKPTDLICRTLILRKKKTDLVCLPTLAS
jgi:hypothetical protein